MRLPASFALVAAGGAAGGLLRYGATQVFAEPELGFAWTTFAINAVGSLALGFLVAGSSASAAVWLRPALGTGLIGGFTTFSAISQSVQATTSAGMGWSALSYVAATVVVGLLAATTGLGLGARWAVRRGEHEANLGTPAPGAPGDRAEP